MENNLTKAKLYWGIKADQASIHQLPEVKDKKHVRVIPFYGMGNLLTNLGFISDDTQVVVIAGIPAINLLDLSDIIQAPLWKSDGVMIPRPQIVVLVKENDTADQCITGGTLFRCIFDQSPEASFQVELTKSEVIHLRAVLRRELINMSFSGFLDSRPNPGRDRRKATISSIDQKIRKSYS